MNIVKKFQDLILKISGICPAVKKYLCLRWNINTLAYWDSQYGSNQAEEHWGSQFRLEFYDLAATALPRTPATILDVGSGLGHGGKHLMTICDQWQVEGLDFSSKACRNAVIKSHCVDLCSDRLPGEYDYILTIQTLEHLPDPMPILDKLYEAARKAVIITVPYKGQISPTHPTSFDEDSFSKFPNAEIKTSKRKAPNNVIKTDMLVVLKKSLSG